MNPYYERNGITIYHGDCREILPSVSADAVVSDPPYGIGFVKGAGGKGAHNVRNIAPVYGDDQPFDPSPWLSYKDVILWGANHFAALLPHGRWLAWDKLNGVESYDSFSDVEFAWHNKRAADRIFRYLWKGICRDGERETRRAHPTQKPIALMKWCIGFVAEDAVILDPFMGSGTTLVAAKETGRKAIGIEIEERYCEIAAKRLEQEVLPLEVPA